MKKRFEGIGPELDPPDGLPDEGKSPEKDFEQHLADLLWIEEQAQEDGDVKIFHPNKSQAPVQKAGAHSGSPAKASAGPVPQPKRRRNSGPALRKPLPVRTTPRPAVARGVELQPARLELRPSAQEISEPILANRLSGASADNPTELPKLRPDLSDIPFAPPEEDPTLEELFPGSTSEEPSRAVLTPEQADGFAEPAHARLLQSVRPEGEASGQPSAQLPQEPSGPLPSLEELFGPAEVLPEPEEQQLPDPQDSGLSPAQKTGGRNRMRRLLRSLLAPQTPAEFAEEALPLEGALTDMGPEAKFASNTQGWELDPLPDKGSDAAERASLLKDRATTQKATVDDPSHGALEGRQKPEENLLQASGSGAPSVPGNERPERSDAHRHRGRGPRKKGERGAGGDRSALPLEELMAAAVPIEEVPAPVLPPMKLPDPSKGEKRRRKKGRKHPVPPTEADAQKQTAAAGGRRHPGQADRPAPDEAAKSQRAARSPQEIEASADPIPSADVRRGGTEARMPELAQQMAPQPSEEPAVLHPEEAYRRYAKPLGEIGSSLIITGMFTMLSLFFTLYLSKHWSFLPGMFSGGITVYIQLALLILIILVNQKRIFCWKSNGGSLCPGLLLALVALFTAVDCFHAARELRAPFTVVFGGLMLVCLWGEYARGLAILTTIKVLREDMLAAGVSEVPEVGEGRRGLVRTEPDTEQFMRHLETRDLTATVFRIYAPVAAVCGVVLTLILGFGLKRDLAWTGALIFLGSVPVSALVAFPRLFLLLSRRLAETDAALCGYHGAVVFGKEHSILIGDEDIFPAGSLTFNGFKVYNNSNPDRVIAYAAAAARSSGSALDPIFEDLLVTHNGRHYTVDSFRFYDSGGIGASIGEDVILMGSQEFMRRMGVHMDKGTRVRQAVYLSLNGELAAVFAIRYAPPEKLRKGLASIAVNRHFRGILVTRTFLGTPGFIKAKFGIPVEAFRYPATAERIRLSELEMKRTGAQGAILAKDSFSGFARAVAAGRMLRSTTLGAAILSLLNGFVGLLLMGVLAYLPAQETATALNLLLYCAAWLIPTLLLTVWARHF